MVGTDAQRPMAGGHLYGPGWQGLVPMHPPIRQRRHRLGKEPRGRAEVEWVRGLSLHRLGATRQGGPHAIAETLSRGCRYGYGGDLGLLGEVDLGEERQ